MIYTADVKISKNPRIFYSFFSSSGKGKTVCVGDYSSMEEHFEDIPLTNEIICDSTVNKFCENYTFFLF